MSTMIAVNVCLLPPVSISNRISALSSRCCVPRDLPEESPLRSIGYQLAQRREQDDPLVHPASSSSWPLPHITLTQLFMSPSPSDDGTSTVLPSEFLNDVQHAISKVMINSAAVRRGDDDGEPVVSIGVTPYEGPLFVTLPNGDEIRCPGLPVIPAPTIKSLHEEVSSAVMPHRLSPSAVVNSYSEEALGRTFINEWPGNRASIDWVVGFEHKNAHDKYFPHITLGSWSKCINGDLQKMEVEVDQSSSSSPNHHDSVAIPITQCDVVCAQMGCFCTCCRILHRFSWKC